MPDFLLDKLSAASAENRELGDLVFAIIAGAVMEPIVFGQPLAIIGLFTVSILDRRNGKATEGHYKLILAGLGRSFPVERLRRNNSVDGRHKS